jgi:hypothetical protein
MKRTLAALAAAVVFAGCGGSTSPDPTPPPAQEPSGLPTRVVGDAQDVADRLEQRNQDIESLVP